MDAKLWQRLKPLLDRALKEPESARAGYVAECTDDPEIRSELMHLLESSQTGELPAGSELDAPRASTFQSGDILLGRFHIVRLVGRGGMGEVYEAEDLELGRIALKTIRLRSATRPGMLAQFKQEIQLARKVSGPNVCRIFELFTIPEKDGQSAAAFLTMEFLDGVVLSERLRHQAMDWKEARRLALDICAGLTAIHEAGVLHRDLKSSNIMLAKRNGVERAVLTDFGLAMPLGAAAGGSGVATGSSSHVVAGTPEYMSPEQFEGGQLTGASDVYALGVVLYEMVTGRHPYEAHTPLAAAVKRAKRPDLAKAPAGWREIIFRCLEYDPAARYKSAGEVAAAIRRAANPVAQVSHDAAGAIRRSKIAVTVVVMAIAGLVGWQVIERMRMHKPAPQAVRQYDKGVAALREATYVKAINALQFAVESDPRFAMAHERLAEAWSELDFTETADQEMLIATTEAHEENISARDKKYLAASQATLTRDYRTAVKEYREILDDQTEEEKPAGLVDVGRAEEKAGDMKGALREYQAAAKLAPDQPAAFVHIGILESRMQHAAEAKAAFEQAEKVYRADTNAEGLAEIEYQQGYLENEQGNTAEARGHLEASLTEAKRIPSVQLEIRALGQLSGVESDAGNQKQAIEDANQAIDLANRNQLEYWAADGLVRRADAYLQMGAPADLVEAEAAVQQAMAIAHQSRQRRVEARANIDMANLRSGNPAEAEMYAQRALDFYKPYGFGEGVFNASLLLARVQRNRDELGPAMTTSQALLAEAEKAGSPRAVVYAEDLIGSILLREEQYPQALEILTKAMEGSNAALRPYEAEACAKAMWRLGDYGGADELMRKNAARGVSEDAEVTRIAMAMSQQQYGKAAALADAAMAGMDRSARPLEFVMAKSVAQAHLATGNKGRVDAGKLEEAKQEIDGVKAGVTAAESGLSRAEWELAAGEIALAGNDWAGAKADGEAAFKYFRGVKAVESEVKAAALVTRACRAQGEGKEGAAAANFGLDILHQLHESWSPTQYQAFLSRPDIKDAAQQLEEGASAR